MVQELNCAGPKHAHFRDLDGTLLSGLTGAGWNATAGDTAVGYFGSPRSFPYDQVCPCVHMLCYRFLPFTT